MSCPSQILQQLNDYGFQVETPPQEIELAKRRKEMYFSGQREML